MPDPSQEKAPGTASGEAWDPLQTGSDDLEFVLAAQKREIRNILKSYTGYYDLFSELIQNSLDAVEKRSEEGSPGYRPEIWITIDIHKDTVSVRQRLRYDAGTVSRLPEPTCYLGREQM